VVKFNLLLHKVTYMADNLSLILDTKPNATRTELIFGFRRFSPLDKPYWYSPVLTGLNFRQAPLLLAIPCCGLFFYLFTINYCLNECHLITPNILLVF
jgi:hypothetical protein